jgi:hypothetical protein
MRTRRTVGLSTRTLLSVGLVAVTLASTACASLSNKEKGAVIGAAAGGAAGEYHHLF